MKEIKEVKEVKYYKQVNEEGEVIGVIMEDKGSAVWVSDDSILINDLAANLVTQSIKEATQNYFYNYYKQTMRLIQSKVAVARNSKTK